MRSLIQTIDYVGAMSVRAHDVVEVVDSVNEMDSVNAMDAAGSVGSPILEHVQSVTAVYDYGQFYLYTNLLDEVDYSEVVDDAIASGKISQEGPLLVVLSPHQNNFEMPLRVERWSARPLDDLDDWQEAFTASIDVDSFGLWYESATTIQNLRLDVPPGRYVVRIVGRGFVSRGWPGSTKPGDEWRFQLWPRSGSLQEPERLKAWNE
ncbi:hypothetical protein [Pseudofrankia asymbiotica]|uniref:Uncharacterized protein n=1 Tax=Pseudofrankia asymbiotica TaxID=1834516 RepID=A0A1V2I134_9ACTN|nr:hypothetical protein [Pseudofrankia asymbiotica]ONH21905.1 hypothetical protein BL253_37410 [Pseudofrankia asymbiotica]